MAKSGPSTEAGKAAVHLNAVQHGMLSESPVVPWLEREEDWQGHLGGIEASLRPADHFESALTQRIALLLWRLRRVAAFETETLTMGMGDVDAAWKREEDARKELAAMGGFYGKAGAEAPAKEEWREEWLKRNSAKLMIPQGETLERVLRYEAHLHRQLLQTMHELEALQARRQGQSTPLARLDVAGGPGT